MIQGGDPTGTGSGGESIWGGEFADEFTDKLSNIAGSIAMANRGPNTNGSQFFIVQEDSKFLDGRHSIIGQVVEGMDVVDRIASVPTDLEDKPLEKVTVLRVQLQ